MVRRLPPLLVVLGLFALPVQAASPPAPFVPATDETVLQVLPAGKRNAQLHALQAQLATQADDLPAALKLARGYIDVARNAGDSRYSSYALATLQPWQSRKLPASDAAHVLTLIAIAQQNLHRFDAALVSLQQALQLDPQAGQAWLTQATVLALRGRFAEARRACGPLARTYDTLIALTCLASVDARSGKLEASFAALTAVYRDDPRLDPGIRLWILIEQADMAERLGKPDLAQRYLADALRIEPTSIAAKSSLADLLLRRARPAEVLTLLGNDADQDALLLRLAIAAHRSAPGSPQARDFARLYQQRVVLAQRPDEPQHLREEARFQLEVHEDAARSLQVARANFAIQREPEDVRIYRLAARAAGASGASDVAELERWQRDTGYEDRS